MWLQSQTRLKWLITIVMVTIVKLINVASSRSCLISLVMRAPEIYRLSNFSVFSRVLPTVVIMLYLSLLDIHLIYLQLCPLGQISPHSSHLPTHPSNHCSAPCFSVFDFFKTMTPHSSTLAWQIPWTEDPDRLQSMGSRRVGYDWVTSLSFSLSCMGEGNGNPLQCSCLENPRDRGAWWAAIYGVTQSRTRLKWLSRLSIVDLQYCVSFKCIAK